MLLVGTEFENGFKPQQQKHALLIRYRVWTEFENVFKHHQHKHALSIKWLNAHVLTCPSDYLFGDEMSKWWNVVALIGLRDYTSSG